MLMLLENKNKELNIVHLPVIRHDLSLGIRLLKLLIQFYIIVFNIISINFETSILDLLCY